MTCLLTTSRLLLLLRHLPLSLRERYLFAMAPVDPEDSPVTGALLTFAAAYCHRHVLGCLQPQVHDCKCDGAFHRPEASITACARLLSSQVGWRCRTQQAFQPQT